MTHLPAEITSVRRAWWVLLMNRCISVFFPMLAILIAVRIVMSPLYLQFEYERPDFPVDPYGFTLQDRLNYAPYALDYLLNGAGIEYLGNLHLLNNVPMYTQRELDHMRDVKAVTQTAYALALAAGALTLIFGVVLVIRPDRRESLRFALRNGALLTLLILFAVVIVVVVNWDFFFTTFHELFFANGTWMFYTSDTLIRLFPEQFWFDAAITIGVMAGVFSLITLAAAILTRPRRTSTPS